VQHFSFFDYAALSGSMQERTIEFVDHLHEHFTDPVRVVGGRYAAPSAPGIGARMHEDSLATWEFPDGDGWRRDRNGTRQEEVTR